MRRLRQVRREEAVLWLVLVTAVLNFAPSLFTSSSVSEDPLWTKAVKDVPLLLLLGVAVFAPRRSGRTQRDLRDWLSGSRTRPFREWDLSGLVLLPLALLAAFVALDITLRGSAGLGTLVSVRYYLVYPLLVWAVPRLGLSAQELLRLLRGIILLGALEGVIAVLDFVGAFGNTFYAGYVRLDDYLFPRAIATLGNPNNLAIFLALPAMLLVGTRVYSLRPRIWLVVPIMLGIILTFSKAVAAAFAVSAFLLLPLRRLPRRWAIALAATSVVMACGALVVRSGGHLSPDLLLGSRSKTFSRALDQWTATPSSFLFGTGFGSQSLPTNNGTLKETVIDNMVLAMALEGGLLALFLFGSVVAAALAIVLRARAVTGSPLAAALSAYATFFLLYTPVVVNFRLFPGAMFFWLAAGLAAFLLGTSGSVSRTTGAHAPSEPPMLADDP